MYTIALLAFFSYVAGSIPFAKLIGLLHGVDIQKRGSGNIGFANTLRVLGWKAALPVLVLDIAKGFLPTYIAYGLYGAEMAFCIGILAVIGHIAPLWLRFKGGKGVATSLGVVLAVTPLVGLIGFAVYILCSILFRTSSTASIIAGCTVLLMGLIAYPFYWWAYAVLLLIAAFMLRKNLTGKVVYRE